MPTSPYPAFKLQDFGLAQLQGKPPVSRGGGSTPRVEETREERGKGRTGSCPRAETGVCKNNVAPLVWEAGCVSGVIANLGYRGAPLFNVEDGGLGRLGCSWRCEKNVASTFNGEGAPLPRGQH